MDFLKCAVGDKLRIYSHRWLYIINRCVLNVYAKSDKSHQSFRVIILR